eukprot:4524139-Pyramimonas_sp.AAC.1
MSHVRALQPRCCSEAESPPFPEKSSKTSGLARAPGSDEVTRGLRPGAAARSRRCARPSGRPRAAGRPRPAAAAGR